MVRSSRAAIGLVVIAVITAAAGSACGSDAGTSRVEQPSGGTPSDSGSPAASDTASSWAAEANRICAAADDEIDMLPAPRSASELSSFFASVTVMNKRWNDELTALGAPPGAERRFDRLAKLLAEDERLLDRLLAALTAGDRKAFAAAMAEYEAVGERQDALWRALGAKRCAEGSYTPSSPSV
jgi:hypothetical protein